MKTRLKQLIKDTSGQALLAHVLLLAAIALTIVPTVHDVGARLAEVFNRLTDALR